MRPIFHRRGQRPLVIIDLAIPRDFDPQVERISSVFLCNIDDLTEIVKENLRGRRDEIPKVERVVGEEVGKFSSLLRYRTDVEPLVERLYRESEVIQRAELEALEASLEPETFRKLQGVVRAVSRKILYLQTERLKSLRDGGGLGPEEAQLLRRIFLPEDEGGNTAGDAR
jgi:glutamyl-tRNA reductase